MTAFDGGIQSVEAQGRGRTIAATPGTVASPVENPAALESLKRDSFYTSTYVGVDSDVPTSRVEQLDPLGNNIVQFIGLNSNKGALFYEPLGRMDRVEILDATSPSDNFRDIDFAANAIGFGGASMVFNGRGTVGLSIAYLRSSLSALTRRTGQPDLLESDTGNGVRLNFGMQYRTGPAFWGITFQNAPGFVWWEDHKRNLLPVKIRVGNLYKLTNKSYFSIEGESRFYNEGSDNQDLLYLGHETYMGERMILRLGIYGEKIDDPDYQHYTAGLSLRVTTDAEVSYALDSFREQDERVIRSYVALRVFSGATP